MTSIDHKSVTVASKENTVSNLTIYNKLLEFIALITLLINILVVGTL